MLNESALDKIRQTVWNMFPEMKGVEPRVNSAPTPKAATEVTALVFIFQTTVSAPGGKLLPRWVRVTTDPGGKIRKISTSR